MIKGIIFDLDQTIVDSSIAASLRQTRAWQLVYKLIPSFTVYPGFDEVFLFLRENCISCCIVTTTPGSYASKVADYFNIPCEFIIDYYSTSMQKPHPEPMLKALERFNLPNYSVLSIGDRAIDIQSSKSAGIKSVACTWGTYELPSLLASNPDYVISESIEITNILINNQ
jgi:phosphoglycolate phosphatase-like HAD superfamily hydrolase